MFDSISIGGRGTPSAVVVGTFKGKGLGAAGKAQDAGGGLAQAVKRPEYTGEYKQLVEDFPKSSGSSKSPERVIAIGLGTKEKLTAGCFREIGAVLAKKASAIKANAIRVDFSDAIKDTKLDEGACGSALAEGFALAAWTYDDLRGSATPDKKFGKIALQADSKAFASGMDRGLGLATSANITRDLSQTPPNIATTTYMADRAKKMARQTGLTCTVYKGKQLEDMGLTGCMTVGAASEHPPCMIRLEYTPKSGGKKSKPTVLVGKTIVYDSGGLSLKINNSMKCMKRDKDGGCAIFGAMHAIATVIKPKHRVVALLMCAENSVSDEAYRPDDVLEFANGVTVEVTNTDAEGRLVLADGLIHACSKENPAAVIDMATLTGGVVVALGSVYAGIWCDDDKLRTNLEEAGEASGERVWRLPLGEDYREMMKSPVADIVNSAPVREAHPIQGAAFLSYFVEEGIPWAHIDIAGTHVTDREKGVFGAGPTGFGTRLLAEYFDSK